MRYEELESWSEVVAKWATAYFSSLRELPVRAQVKPGEIASKIATQPPEAAESMASIFDDFQRLILPGMTHWQHPRFFAYFPANAAPASMIAEQIVSTMAAQCMLWQTSPAATELETVMVDWLRQSFGLHSGFTGVLQDSATSATLAAVLTMRDRALNWRCAEDGLYGSSPLRIYASDQNHSSIEKAVRLAGIGKRNLVKIPTDSHWAMRSDLLQRAIEMDRAQGYLPAGVIGCIGGTSIGASDRLDELLSIARQEGLYSHVDAAWAGSAMICPELRALWSGIDLADSVVVNPHKWLGANFDCSVQFLREPQHQIRTMAIRPRYLETLDADPATNYSEWTIPLGRRFRALKLWFLFRAYGLDGLRARIRSHLQWAELAADRIAAIPHVELTTSPRLSLFTFRLAPPGRVADETSQELLEQINADGRIYLSHTTHSDQFVIRFSIGQFETTWEDVEMAVQVIEEFAVKVVQATA